MNYDNSDNDHDKTTHWVTSLLSQRLLSFTSYNLNCTKTNKQWLLHEFYHDVSGSCKIEDLLSEVDNLFHHHDRISEGYMWGLNVNKVKDLLEVHPARKPCIQGHSNSAGKSGRAFFAHGSAVVHLTQTIWRTESLILSPSWQWPYGSSSGLDQSSCLILPFLNESWSCRCPGRSMPGRWRGGRGAYPMRFASLQQEWRAKSI